MFKQIYTKYTDYNGDPDLKEYMDFENDLINYITKKQFDKYGQVTPYVNGEYVEERRLWQKEFTAMTKDQQIDTLNKVGLKSNQNR